MPWPQNKLNSLRYLGVLCVSAVFPGLAQTLNKLCDWTFLQQRLLSCLGQPREHRRDAENAEVAQRSKNYDTTKSFM
jgi:hypothetical protein